MGVLKTKLPSSNLCKTSGAPTRVSVNISYGWWVWISSENLWWVETRFISFWSERGYKLKRPKPRHTTNSNHRYHKYKNLIKDFKPLSPNLLWVSDITYIPLSEGKRCYLHLATDAYSHKIIGWCLSDSLEAKNTLAALQMAIKQAENCNLSHLIHHSDRGVQYCCNMYIDALENIRCADQYDGRF